MFRLSSHESFYLFIQVRNQRSNREKGGITDSYRSIIDVFDIFVESRAGVKSTFRARSFQPRLLKVSLSEGGAGYLIQRGTLGRFIGFLSFAFQAVKWLTKKRVFCFEWLLRVVVKAARKGEGFSPWKFSSFFFFLSFLSSSSSFFLYSRRFANRNKGRGAL